MIKLILSEIVDAIAGRPSREIPTVSISGVCTDSRTTRSGDLFFAIAGPNFDGHDFIGQALTGGAVAAVVQAGRLDSPPRGSLFSTAADCGGLVVEVDDTIQALGQLGAFHRTQLPANVIGVVGSNGKTTTKAMIDHILRGRWTGRCSPKSFNNSIGVPLTLLSADRSDEYLVVEIGTNARGEIERLAQLAQPDMAVITCIGEEHLEGLSDLAGVAAEEASVLRQVRRGGFAAVNIDSQEIRPHLDAPGVTLATFGRAAGADLHLTAASYHAPWTRFELNGRFEYRLRVPGAHNAVNATAAIMVARRMGMDHAEIAARLESFALPPMRNEIRQIGPITVINDAYNANPHSAAAALDVLRSIQCAGRRIVVFGEMRELGNQSAELHRRVAQEIGGYDLDMAVLVGAAGELMFEPLLQSRRHPTRVERCATVAACADFLIAELRDGDVLLLKASRAVELERLMEPLKRRFEVGPETSSTSESRTAAAV